MAEGDGALYNNFKAEEDNASFDLAADQIKVMLVAGYTPNIDTHTKYSDVSAFEVAYTNYVAGGNVLAGGAVTIDTGTDTIKFDGTNVTFTLLGAGLPSHAIMYDNTHADKLLIAYWALGRASDGNNYILAWHANGIMTKT